MTSLRADQAGSSFLFSKILKKRGPNGLPFHGLILGGYHSPVRGLIYPK